MALADKASAASTVRDEGSLREVEDLIANFVVTCDGDDYIAAAKSVTYGEWCRVDVIF